MEIQDQLNETALHLKKLAQVIDIRMRIAERRLKLIYDFDEFEKWANQIQKKEITKDVEEEFKRKIGKIYTRFYDHHIKEGKLVIIFRRGGKKAFKLVKDLENNLQLQKNPKALKKVKESVELWVYMLERCKQYSERLNREKKFLKKHDINKETIRKKIGMFRGIFSDKAQLESDRAYRRSLRGLLSETNKIFIRELNDEIMSSHEFIEKSLMVKSNLHEATLSNLNELIKLLPKAKKKGIIKGLAIAIGGPPLFLLVSHIITRIIPGGKNFDMMTFLLSIPAALMVFLIGVMACEEFLEKEQKKALMMLQR